MIDIASPDALLPAHTIACQRCGQAPPYLPVTGLTAAGDLRPIAECAQCVLANDDLPQVDLAELRAIDRFLRRADCLMWLDNPEAEPKPTYVHAEVPTHLLPNGGPFGNDLAASVAGVVLREGVFPTVPERLMLSPLGQFTVLWVFWELRDTGKRGNPVVSRQTLNLATGSLRLDLLNVEHATEPQVKTMRAATEALNANVEQRGRPKGSGKTQSGLWGDLDRAGLASAVKAVKENPTKANVIGYLVANGEFETLSETSFRKVWKRCFPEAKNWPHILRIILKEKTA